MEKISSYRPVSVDGEPIGVAVPAFRSLRSWVVDGVTVPAFVVKGGHIKGPAQFMMKGGFVGSGARRRMVVAGKIGRF